MKRAAEQRTREDDTHSRDISPKVPKQSDFEEEHGLLNDYVDNATDVVTASLQLTEWNEDSESQSSSDEEYDDTDVIQLSDIYVMHPHKIMAKRRNIVDGEIRSTISDQNHPCVIKFDQNPEQITREANSLRKIGTHCNVVCLIDAGICQDTMIDIIYVVLEKCHKLNLEQYLHCENALPIYDINRGLKFCKQIINGVKYIHEKLIIHKDLKLSNILLTLDLENVKIADFGSSQEIKSSSSMVSCPSIFGTLGYRPPESLNRTYASLKSDSYSLGVVFYVLLSGGMSPFGSHSELWDHNIQNNIIDLSCLLVPNPLVTQHLIKSMLNFDRCCRPPIEAVEQHPCWNGEECAVSFSYNYEDEIDDNDTVGESLSEVESEDSEDEFLRALESIPNIDSILKLGQNRSRNHRTSTVTYNSIIKILQNCYEELGASEADELGMALIAAAEVLMKDQTAEALRIAMNSIPRSLSADDINNMGTELEEEHPICAIIMHRAAAAQYSRIPKDVTPEEAVSWFSNRISNISCVVEQIMETKPPSDLKNIALTICPKLMAEVLHDLRAVKNAKGKAKTLCEVSYYVCITRIYLNAARNHGEPLNPTTIDLCKEGLDCLKAQFGKNMQKYRYCGYLINNTGEAYLLLGMLDDAEPYLKSALSMKKASTYRTRDARRIHIGMTQRNLDELQRLRNKNEK